MSARPANAGIQVQPLNWMDGRGAPRRTSASAIWIPAFAGMSG